MKKTVKKYVVLTLASVLLFAVEHKQATAWRGYKAIGGEHLILLIPILYALSKDTFKMLWQDVKRGISASGKMFR